MDITENEQQVKSFNNVASEKSLKKFHSAVTELKNKFQIPRVLTKDDLLNRQYQNKKHLIGTTVLSAPPIPNNYKEAFELFENYYAALEFEVQKNMFEDTFKVWNKHSIITEIKVIESWIAKTIEIPYKETLPNFIGNIQNSHSYEHEYLRLANGFYEGYLMSYEQCSESSTAAIVYGRYFLFYEYLKERLKELRPPATTLKSNDAETPQTFTSTLTPDESNNPMGFISDAEIVKMWEQNLKDKIPLWIKGKDKTGCAVYCNYLLTKHLFVPNEKSTAKKYALAKFHCNISATLDRIRKTPNAKKLNEDTETIVRVIRGIKYGTI